VLGFGTSAAAFFAFGMTALATAPEAHPDNFDPATVVQQHLLEIICGRPNAAETISAMPHQRQRCAISSANV
jgi:hypothetical protein